MSSTSSPPKPKPGSLRDRIAAFEQKPASSSAPPPAPRPKPGNLSQWKPRAPSPQDTQPVNDRNDTSMSASDAKESITKGGSLKERMAALQGLGAFGGGSAATPPPKPAEKPKWKPPPQVAIAPPLTGDDDDDDEGDSADADTKPAISQLTPPSDDVIAALPKHPQQDPQPVAAQERHSEIEGEEPTGEEALDPDEEERQRRAAIAARMARLGGTRVGMGPPIFGRKPEIKPKPSVHAPGTTKDADVVVAEPAPKSEVDAQHAQAETEIATNVPLPTSPPTNETLTETLSPQPLVTTSEYFPQQSGASTSPNISQRTMPVPQGPRRAAPPRKKSSQKQTPPVETGAIASSLEKTSIHDGSETFSESQSAPVPVLGDVEPEVRATDPAGDVHASDLADKKLESTEQSFGVAVPPVLSPEAVSAPAPPRSTSPRLDPQPDRLDNPEVDPSPTQAPYDTAEPSSPTVSRIAQEETEVEEVAVPYAGDGEALVAAEEEDEDDTGRGEIAEHVAKLGGFDPLGEHPTRSLGEEPYISSGVVPESHSAAPALPSEAIPYSVFQQGGGATAVDEEDDGNDESDPHAQAPLQHTLDLRDLEGGSDYDDAHTRVPHEVEVGAFTQTAEIGQHSGVIEGERVVAASSPPSTVHGQHATEDFGTTQAHAERASLAPTLSADDISDDEMAPPRVTRPLPPAPEPSDPVSNDLVAALSRAPPPPPSVPRRVSLPPPVRAVPVPSTDSPPRIQGSSPQRVPIAKRTSLLPPSREIPTSAPDTVDLALLRPQPSTRRTSLPPPTRGVPPPSISREGSFVPPPPPPPPSFSYSEQDSLELGHTKEAFRTQDEVIAPPPPAPTPTRKPSIAPPTPDGRRIVESRRSSDSRHSHEERRGTGQYATLTAPVISGPISPPSKKRVPPPLPLEKEILDEDIADPIDPRFHTPSKSPIIPAIPRTPSPTSGTSVPPMAPPATPPAQASSENESGRDSLQRRRTIAERMAQLGGIKLGVPPPPVNRVQPSAPTQPVGDAGTEGSAAADSGQPVPGEEEEEEDEQARRQRIAAKIAGMGGMRFGMLPVQPGATSVTPPPPPIPVRPEEEATPRSPLRDIAPPRQPEAYYHEYEQEYEQPSSSDDGVQVEAEESELEEVRHEDLEDDYDDEGVEEQLATPLPPPPPPRSTRPPVPSTRPTLPVIPPSLVPGRSGSFSTITSAARPPVRQSVSDFVMVEPEEAPLPSPVRLRGHVPQWSVPPPQESSDLAGSGQWELPSIPSGSLDLGNSVIIGDLSGSMWSEDSTTYPSAAPPLVSQSPPTSVPQQPVGQQPRAPAAVVPAQVTADELRALWFRVGAQVGEAASRLHERSKRTLVGDGSYESFIAEAFSQVPNVSPPRRPGEYGILIYAQTGPQVHTRLTDVMPGDIAVLDGAKLKGYKGLHTYSMSAGEGTPCMGVVSEFDVKKLKLKVLQANQRVGQATVVSVSYRLDDLKSGSIKVYRVREA